jgi:hypothetical protein
VSQKLRFALLSLATLATISIANIARAEDPVDALVQDRIAIERVYYNRRTGAKRPFELAMPRTLAEKLVREDLRKEAVLKKIYHVEIAGAQIDAEIQRINASTRAPEVLTELKAALDNDPARFARTVAKPLVVDRTLRDKFDNDDALHAAQRRQVESVRAELLAAKQNHIAPDNLLALLKRLGSNDVTETTWQLGKPPEDRQPADGKPRFYFEDLPSELQQVLRVQLRQPGDISAAIETPVDFRLYLCETNTPTALAAASLSIPKRRFEEWLAHQAN